MHFEVSRHLAPEELRELEARIRLVLGDVQAAVRDHEAMRARVPQMIDAARSSAARYALDEIEEARAFLEWLLDGNFVLLGYREYALADGKLAIVAGRRARDPGRRLRLALRDAGARGRHRPAPARAPGRRQPARRLEDEPLRDRPPPRQDGRHHREARRRARQHGRAPAAARHLHAQGVHGAGLEDADPRQEAPPDRRRRGPPRGVARPQGAGRALRVLPQGRALRGRPGRAPPDPRSPARPAGAPPHPALRPPAPGRGPRLRDGRACRATASTPSCGTASRIWCVQRFNGSSVDYHLSLGDEDQARIHFTIHVDGTIPDVSFAELEQEVVAVTRTWDDRLRERLGALHGEEKGNALAGKYEKLLPDYYKSSTDVYLALLDIEQFERLEHGEDFAVGLQNERGQEQNLTRIGLYKTGGKVRLSDFLPILEHLGLTVVEEVPTRLHGDGDVYLHDFGVLDSNGQPLHLSDCGARVADAISAVWRGEAESDSLNRLVISAGLDWRQVAVLRAYRKYRQRVSAAFTEEYQNDAFAHNPAIAGKLVELFERRFDPARERDAEAEQTLSARDPRRPRPGPLARRGQDPARAFRARQRDRPYERVPSRAALPLLQAPLGRGAGHAEAPAALRDLRVLAGDGGHPSPRRPDSSRRDPLVGSQGGLPHGGARPHEGADGEERHHRARGVEGRVRAEARARRQRGAGSRGRRAVLHPHARPSRPHRQPRRRGGRPSARRADTRRRRSVPGRGRRQGHGHVLGHRERHRGRVRVLARRRLRIRRLARLRPQGPRHHRSRRLGVGQAPLPRARARRADPAVHRRRHRRHVRRRLRERDVAVRADPPGRGVRPPARVPRPESGSGSFLRRAQAPLRAARVVMGRLRPLEALGRRRRLVASGEVDASSPRRRGRRSAWSSTPPRPPSSCRRS